MDGHFVPNITFGPETCKAIRPHIRTVMDVHLMIAPVDPYIAKFAEAGADVLTAHVEAGPHLDRTLQAIRDHGCKAGVALNPATPPEAIGYVLGPHRPGLRDDGEPGLRRAEFHPRDGAQGPAAARDDRRPADPHRDRWRGHARNRSCGRRGRRRRAGRRIGRLQGRIGREPRPYGDNIRAIRAAAGG